MRDEARSLIARDEDPSSVRKDRKPKAASEQTEIFAKLALIRQRQLFLPQPIIVCDERRKPETNETLKSMRNNSLLKRHTYIFLAPLVSFLTYFFTANSHETLGQMSDISSCYISHQTTNFWGRRSEDRLYEPVIPDLGMSVHLTEPELICDGKLAAEATFIEYSRGAGLSTQSKHQFVTRQNLSEIVINDLVRFYSLVNPSLSGDSRIYSHFAYACVPAGTRLAGTDRLGRCEDEEKAVFFEVASSIRSHDGNACRVVATSKTESSLLIVSQNPMQTKCENITVAEILSFGSPLLEFFEFWTGENDR